MSALRGRFLRLLVLCLCCSVEAVSASAGPKTLFSTNLGGSGFDEGFAVATDSAGNVYVAGLTNSPSFPGTSTAPSGPNDCFVTKFSPAGQILYSRLIGGSAFDDAYGIAVDTSGNVYVTGDTLSPDFPIVNGFQTTYGGGFSDAFIAKLDPSGKIVYSSYIGGSGGNEAGNGIAVDNTGNAYITGRTNSTDFLANGPAQTIYGGGLADAFVVKVNTTMTGISSLVYSTYLGGPSFDVGNAIAVNSNGEAYVTGTTGCCVPTTPDAFQTFAPGSAQVFMTKLGPAGNILYSTVVGGSGHDVGRGIAINTSGDVFVTGETSSLDFPTTASAFQNTSKVTRSNVTAFVLELNPATPGKGGLVYSSYLGGQGPDSGSGVAVDSLGHIFITGYTDSADFPIQTAIQSTLTGFENGFLTELDPTIVGPAALVFGTFLGSNFDDQPLGVALASDERIAVVGFTDLLPYGSSRDAFVDYFSFDTVPPVLSVPSDITLNATSPAGVSTAFAVTATDNADLHPTVSCQPISGSLFPIGTTVDTCNGTDASGNTATKSFRVIVESAPQQIADLERYIAGMTLPNGLANSLTSKLQSATQDSLRGACSDLSDFVSQINAQTNKAIPLQQGIFLNESATRIQAVLGCY